MILRISFSLAGVTSFDEIASNVCFAMLRRHNTLYSTCTIVNLLENLVLTLVKKGRVSLVSRYSVKKRNEILLANFRLGKIIVLTCYYNAKRESEKSFKHAFKGAFEQNTSLYDSRDIREIVLPLTLKVCKKVT